MCFVFKSTCHLHYYYFHFLDHPNLKGKRLMTFPKPLPHHTRAGNGSSSDWLTRPCKPFRNMDGVATRSTGVAICISPCLTFFLLSKKKNNLKSTHNARGEFSRTSCRCYGYFHLIIILAIQHICNPCGKLWLTFLPVDAGQMQKPKRSVPTLPLPSFMVRAFGCV